MYSGLVVSGNFCNFVMMNNDNEAVYSETYFLTAGESNARGEMPTTLVAERMIEIATNHANRLGIGFATLSPMGVAWVLSRLGFVMNRVPKINEHYTITTWIESWNRLFSDRCFRFSDAAGNTIGYGRTVWATIDIATRAITDLSHLADRATVFCEECAMPKMRNHAAVTAPTRRADYTFAFTDLDFNRHVNTVRYIEHILNLWTLSHYDQYRVGAFEIAFRSECLAGQTVTMAVDETDSSRSTVDLIRDGERVVSSSISWTKDPIDQ